MKTHHQPKVRINDFQVPLAILALVIAISEFLNSAVENQNLVFKSMFFFTPDATIHEFFMSNFIQAFGILYGVLLPLQLAKTVGDYSKLEREYELEADTTRLLFEDTLLLSKQSAGQYPIKWHLRKYAKHIIQNSQKEADDARMDKDKGDEILYKVREQIFQLDADVSKPDTKNLVSDLLNRINELEHTRINRINSARQTFSGAFYKIVLILSGSLFLIPFCVNAFWKEAGFWEKLLVFLLMLFILLINAIIADLEVPFAGLWRIKNESWERLLNKMNIS
jgi:hypothetical protein